jgi:hypothetical protein
MDRRIDAHLQRRDVALAPRTSDAEFLRRASLDLTGKLPTPEEITLFALDPDPAKRQRRVEDLLNSDDYARNWARYWRDVILYHATDQRAQRNRGVLEEWFFEQFRGGRGWDKIATDLITATGDISQQGSTGLISAQMAQDNELAAETSRLFLGIQIQCAQCHDHPFDRWTRAQFHELAAFFPRVRVQRQQDAQKRTFAVVSFDRDPAAGGRASLVRRFGRLDADGDGQIQPGEVPERLRTQFDRLLQRADKDGDQVLSLEELKSVPDAGNAQARRRVEHYMPDLEHPDQPGELVHPGFFVTGARVPEGSSDLERRRQLAAAVTSKEDPWFARAFVNRMWAEMMGQGFTDPVDDMGPNRPTALGDVLELLSDAFQANDYDVRWLLGAIAATDTYQRQDRPRAWDPEAPRFAAVCPTRFRADQLFDALSQVLGLDESVLGPARRGGNRRLGNVRTQFAQLFGYDPSLPAADVTGTIPQALFLMNSPVLNARVRAHEGTPLARLLRETSEDEAVVARLYLQTIAREPSPQEVKTCLDYLAEVGDRSEAFEDILWTLLNSTEFLTRR